MKHLGSILAGIAILMFVANMAYLHIVSERLACDGPQTYSAEDWGALLDAVDKAKK